MIIKRIVFLANSRKNFERCVAGIEVLQNGYGDWIRPISLRLGGGLNQIERCYVNNIEPSILDIIDIALISHRPHLNHTEDWLTSTRRHWIKRGSISWNTAFSLVDSPETLWINGWNTFNGINDEMPLNLSKNLQSSLYLIAVSSLFIYVISDYRKTGKRIFASFNYKDVEYKFSVTDSFCEEELKKLDFGDYQYDDCLLTISLSEPFRKNDGNLYQYKLIAAIILKPKE